MLFAGEPVQRASNWVFDVEVRQNKQVAEDNPYLPFVTPCSPVEPTRSSGLLGFNGMKAGLVGGEEVEDVAGDSILVFVRSMA